MTTWICLALLAAPQQPVPAAPPHTASTKASTGATEKPPAIELGLAAKFPDDVGIAQHPAVLFATGFEDGFAGWTRQNPRIFTLVDDAAFAHSGTRCAQATATRGKDTGGEIQWRTERGHDRLFVRFH